MERNMIFESKRRLLNVKGRLLSVFLISSFIILSCTPDITEPENPPISTTNREVLKETPKRESPSPTRMTSASEMIDYRDVDINLLEDLIFQEINKVKKANNLPLLKKDKVLRNAAVDQNNYQIRLGDLSHTQKVAKKRSVGDRISFYGGGFQSMAENVMYEGFIIRTSGTKKEIIAPSYIDQAKKMVRSWMNSPSHRKNIMNPKYDMVGTAVGYHGDLHAVFATQVFGKKF
jgi:uncharacterized protein YkwD